MKKWINWFPINQNKITQILSEYKKSLHLREFYV